MLRYALSRSFSSSSMGTSTVSFTVCLSVLSTVVCIRDQATRDRVRGRSCDECRSGSLRRMYEHELAFAHEIADRAAEIGLSVFGGDVRVTMKPDRTPVTQADTDIESMVRERVAAAHSDDRVLGALADARRTRGFGDFWGHTLVARGAAEAAIEAGLSLWDYAALAVIVEEAGGRVTTLDGQPLHPGGSVLSSNGAIHDELVRRFTRE